MRDVRPTQ